jgi:hypothetical protein
LSGGYPSWKQNSAVRRLCLAALFVVFLGRIVLTYPVFNDTFDESLHIAAGLEVWERHRYTLESQHPPLGRIAVAALPYFLGGLRLNAADDLWGGGMWSESGEAFYWRTLALARAGNLLFAALLFLFVYLWSARLWGPWAGVVSCAVAACCPTILGHASLATLDAGAAAGVLMASYFFWRWAEAPGWRWCLLSAFAFAVAVLTKLSALFFLPPIALVYFAIARWRRPRAGRAAAAAARGAVFAGTAAVLIWAGYLFESGVLVPPGHGYYSRFDRGGENSVPNLLVRTLGPLHLPAHRLVQGIIEVLSHNEEGQRAYLLGRTAQHGWWYYFPAAVAVKSTLPLLLLAAWGVWLRPRQSWGPLVVIAIVMMLAMRSNLNFGIRHVLAIYPMLAILAGGAVAGGRRMATVAAVLLLSWHAAESVAAHPDYLAYFNQLARGREERVLLDSNLDWGQDLGRLARHLREHQIDYVHLSYFGRAEPATLGIRATPLSGGEPVRDWVAVSVNNLTGLYNDPGEFAWLRGREPRAHIGKSIRLYLVE